MLGVERTSGGLRYGLVAAMGQATANFSDPNAHLESDHRAFGGFGSVAIGPVTVDVSALFGTAEDKVTRTDGINTARAAFNTSDTQLGLGVSVNLLPKGSGWQLTPVARVKFTDYSQDGFQETGTGVLVKTGKLSSSSTITKLGARLSRSVELGRDVSLGLDASAFWVHDFDAKGKELNLQLVGYNGSYTSTGRGSDSDAAQFNLGVQAVFNDRWTLRLSGEQEMGVNRTQSTGMFSIAVNF
jgi:outer membrane autotransporter protein